MIVQVKSPLEKAEKLSQTIGNSLFLKREDVQPVWLCQGAASFGDQMKNCDGYTLIAA